MATSFDTGRASMRLYVAAAIVLSAGSDQLTAGRTANA